MNPFFDIEHHLLLGVANIFTKCLYHRVCHEYDAPIIGPTGKVNGSLKLSLERVQGTHVYTMILKYDLSLSVDDVDGDDETDYGSTSGWEMPKNPEGDLAIGSQIAVKVWLLW